MSSLPSVDEALPSTFLASFFREKCITDVNFVSDNAKPRATSIFLQSTNKKEDKSTSRWDSIHRSKSLDGLDSWSRRKSGIASSRGSERRRLKTSYSLSPTSSMLAGQKSLSSKDLDKKSKSSFKRANATSNLPPIFHKQMLELVRADGDHTSALMGNQCADSNPPLKKPIRRGYSSESSLRKPQRKGFIESGSGRSRPRRAGRRGSFETSQGMKTPPSSKNAVWQLSNVDEDGNETDSTVELTPSPLEAASKILKLANNAIHTPPLTSPKSKDRNITRRKSAGSTSQISNTTRAQRAKSPPPPKNCTPPPLRRGQRKTPRRSIRPKSPPLRRSATPPSLSHAIKENRRHSDSSSNTDIELLIHLAQTSSPKLPTRQRSFDTLDSCDTFSEEDFDLIQDYDSSSTFSYENETSTESTGGSKDKKISPSKVRFSPRVEFSPDQPKNPNPFSSRRQYSAPLTGADSSLKSDRNEATLASSRRSKPFGPGSSSSKTILSTSKTGAITRVRKGKARTSSNRDIVKASVLEHSPDSESGEYWFDPESERSSPVSIGKPSIVDMLSAPSLDTPLQKARKKVSSRTSRLPDVPHLPTDTSSASLGKKKKSRRAVK